MADYYSSVLDLIERFYGTATDDGLWQELLHDLRHHLDGEAATLFFTDKQLKPVGSFFGDNVSSDSVSSYQRHFHKVDIRMHRAVALGSNRIVTDGDLVDPEIVRTHEFYQDFLRPIGHRYIVSAMLDLGDGTFAFCSCHRGLKQDHAEQETLDKAKIILPHLHRSLQLRRRLRDVRAAGQAAFEVLNRLGHAVFLIEPQGRVIWQNALADLLLRQQDGLVSTDGELHAKMPNANTELQRLIKSAIDVVSKPTQKPGGMMTIDRPSLKRDYQVLVSPLPGTPALNMAGDALGGHPAAAVFVMDPEQTPLAKSQVLAKLYNLTPAEARLATALASGMSTKQYAERTELSIHYVRWLLKQIEAKTDTRRIVDLIRLLANQTGFFGMASKDD